MKFYFAAANNSHDFSTLVRLNVPRILMSYFDLQKKPEFYTAVRDRDVFIDSGAFSAFTRGITIDRAKYLEFIQHNGIRQFANLDAIGDPDQTWENQKWFESKGVKPLPVWHVGSDFGYLHRIASSYEHFAIGGMVPLARQRKKLQSALDNAWSIIRQYWPRKVHAFGMSSSWILTRYPWFSSDSSSWLSYRKYGQSQDKQVDRRTAHFRLKTKHWTKISEHEVPHFLRLEKFATDVWISRGINWEI